jgi:uncharacterized protein
LAAAVPDVRIRAPVQPSEDAAKVEQAVRNLFPSAVIERRGDAVEARTDTLQDLRNLIRRQKILDASRRSLLRSLDASKTHARFLLNKQAAYKGRVSFSEDLASPLGDLEVDVAGEGLETLFKEMAPMTIRGHPVSEERAEEELAKRRARKKQAVTPEKDLETALEGDDAWPDEAASDEEETA